MQHQQKLEQLKKLLIDFESVTIAFSGGVDSTFLLKVARDVLGDRVFAVIAKSIFFSTKEYSEAVEFVERLGVRYSIVEIDMSAISEVLENTPDRCYICKHKIFQAIKSASLEKGIACVADGSNLDDLDDYRPGMRALNELGVVSPLKVVGLNKDEIRLLSRQLGLSTWNKPPFACLASRIPYGQKIMAEKLSMVEMAEEVLMNMGFRQVRVRHHGEMARIEVGVDERQKFYDDALLDKIYSQFKKIGFKYTALDLKGYRSGSLNEGL